MFSYTKIKDSKLEQIFEASCLNSVIESKYSVEIAEISKKASIQGFRKGHVPTKFVEEKYGKSVRYNSFEKLIQACINEIVTKNDYRLASQPDLDFDENTLFEGGKDFTAKITFSIFPEVPEINLENMVINTYKIEATDEDVSHSLEMFKKQNSTNVKVEREIMQGDVAKIHFKGYIDGIAFKGGEGKDYELEIGSKTFIDTFEEQLIGRKAGDKCDVLVSFPENYQSKELASKPAKFEVEIVEVLEKQPVELTEEFLKSKTKSANVEELKNELKENIEKYYNGFVRDNVKADIFDMIADSLDFEVPAKILKNLIDSTLKSELQENERLSEEKRKSEAEIIENAGKDSKKRIMLSLYIQNLAKKEGINAEESDIFAFLMDEASKTGMNPMELLNLYQQNDKSGNGLKEIIKEKKVYEFIYDKITKNFEILSRQKMEDLTKQTDFSLIKK